MMDANNLFMCPLSLMRRPLGRDPGSAGIPMTRSQARSLRKRTWPHRLLFILPRLPVVDEIPAPLQVGAADERVLVERGAFDEALGAEQPRARVDPAEHVEPPHRRLRLDVPVDGIEVRVDAEAHRVAHVGRTEYRNHQVRPGPEAPPA